MYLGNKLIGISGKIGSGKDFYADYLIEKIFKEYNIYPDHRKFAEKVKLVTSVITDIPEKQMYTHDGKEIYLESFGKTVGEMQQIIGTDIFRAYDNDFWVKATLNDYEPDQCVIVSDVRFTNEANYIKNLGGILIRLDGDPMYIRKNSKRDMTHPSECDLDNYEEFDIVHNNMIGDISPQILWNNLINLS